MSNTRIYDYLELIAIIETDVEAGLSNLSDEIQIKRGEELIGGYYRPIVEAYNSEEYMCNLKESETMEWLMDRYIKDKPYLEKMTIRECISEMRRYNNNDSLRD